ncbi:MAG: hypothetical protein ACTSWG_10475 [Candidatus Helarchaeota archaeon]
MSDKTFFKCPIENFIKNENISKLSDKEIWYKKRNYCLTDCTQKCDILVLLKKIYWELRKPK